MLPVQRHSSNGYNPITYLLIPKKQKMENVKSNRKMNFFTAEEKAILEPYINGSEKFTQKISRELGQKFGRAPINVYQYVYRHLKNRGKATKKQRFNLQKVKVDKTITRDKSVKSNTPMFKHGEFVIPVSSWEVRNNNGATSLVLKFDKSI